MAIQTKMKNHKVVKQEKINKINDKYGDIVKDIINDDKFRKLDDIKHHGGSRLDHVKKVSYYSFKISEKLKLDSSAVARAGLLHDYFLEPNTGIRKRTVSFFRHPKNSLTTAKTQFDLSKKEENIIKSHMFPVSIYIPRYRESVLVSLVDKAVASKDFIRCLRWKFVSRRAYTAVLIALYSKFMD